MVRPFKAGNRTIYAVIGKYDSLDEIYKQIATYKKESFANVKKKFSLELGYITSKGDMDELWKLEIGKFVKKPKQTPCIIAYTGDSL